MRELVSSLYHVGLGTKSWQHAPLSTALSCWSPSTFFLKQGLSMARNLLSTIGWPPSPRAPPVSVTSALGLPHTNRLCYCSYWGSNLDPHARIVDSYCLSCPLPPALVSVSYGLRAEISPEVENIESSQVSQNPAGS